jgi:signal transduction histidine kinase
MMKIDAEVSLQDAEQPRGFLQGVRRHLAQIQAEAHDFLWDLRDPIRVGGNLSAAMVSQIEYLQAMTDVPIRCQRQLGGIFVAPRIQHTILRVARESIGNAIRHAAASQIDVSIMHNKGTLTLVVADDGVGFEKSDVACLEGHYGLIGMRERIEQIGGRLEIEASPGRGTTVCATVMTDEQEPVG